MGAGSQATARLLWGRPAISQAMAHMKPASSRATAVVTWQCALPAFESLR